MACNERNGTRLCEDDVADFALVKANVTDRSPEGTVFMNFHFHEAAVNLLTNPALDPVAKIPEYKVCAVKVEAA